MSNVYRRVEIKRSCSIDDVVSELLEYKKKGEYVCTKFNGHTLYSDKVTLDGAYKEILGMTKEGYIKGQKDWKDDRDKINKKYNGMIPKLIEEYKIKGRKVIPKDKWSDWDRTVLSSLSSLYHDAPLRCCLDIISLLNNGGTLEEVNVLLKGQNHSGTSFKMVVELVREFCPRGKELLNYVK